MQVTLSFKDGQTTLVDSATGEDLTKKFSLIGIKLDLDRDGWFMPTIKLELGLHRRNIGDSLAIDVPAAFVTLDPATGSLKAVKRIEFADGTFADIPQPI